MKIFIFIIAVITSFPAFALNLLTDVEQGGIIIGKTEPANKIFYNGNKIEVDRNGKFIFALGRDAGKEIVITEKRWYGIETDYRFKVDKRKWDIQRINGIAPAMVNPPESEWGRIAQERELVGKARQASSYKELPTCFIVPVLGARISGVFGSQRVYNGEPKNYHGGIDYAAPQGKEIRATADGVVVLAHEDMYYSGKTIIIDHGHGIFSSYLHMSRIMVREGERVRRGENIGMIGSTGRSTGPHLHFGMNWHGVRFDPQTAISNKMCN